MGHQVIDRDHYTAHQVSRVFQINSSKQTLLNAEERGEIPTAHRVQRGKTACRMWETSQLPDIGNRMGFLKKPEGGKVACVFSLKGGNAKSTLCFQLGRSLALHRIRTLIIGLDAQQSVTQTLSRSAKETNEEGAEGVFHILTEGKSWEDLVRTTDLATLSYIPETIELSVLDIWLKHQSQKEYRLSGQVIQPIVNSGLFDVILLDCHPAWSELVTGALVASDTLISPVGADINSFKAAKIFIELLAEFQDELKHQFQNFILVPTMVEPNKLSQNILAKYRLNYEDLCSVTELRRSIAVQEANLLGKSLMEVGFNSPVYQDFVRVLSEINQLFIQ